MEYSQTVINTALAMLATQIREPDTFLKNPSQAKELCILQLAQEKNEVFGVLFLDNQHGIIELEKLFFGTINSSAVHPRVVIQRVLHHNAAAVILTHNHPSGVCEPSLSDIDITKTLKSALNYIDVRVLDHIIVAGTHTVSLAERGQI